MKTILFPTDFSDNAYNALKFALEIADRTKARLILFNAFWVPVYEFDTPPEITQKEKRFRDESLRSLRELEKLAHAAYSHIKVESVVSNGFTADAIIQAAKLYRADLIVMGTQGASGLKEIIMGSNTVDVINKGFCPVLAIPEGAKEVKFSRIVFASNYGESDREEIAFLVDFATIFNAEIIVVHVSEDEDVIEMADQTILRELKKDVKSIVKYSKLQFMQLRGEVLDELNKYIKENKVDLLCMVTTQKHFLGKIFNRSYTHKMAFHTQIPLLVFHSNE